MESEKQFLEMIQTVEMPELVQRCRDKKAGTGVHI